ncbi:hypothetical protein AX16_009847 [Volvariella volvacea WC 439]|nr:hypothetical protein AX16_009847 [Volvariella volvacea WC 439]
MNSTAWIHPSGAPGNMDIMECIGTLEFDHDGAGSSELAVSRCDIYDFDNLANLRLPFVRTLKSVMTSEPKDSLLHCIADTVYCNTLCGDIDSRLKADLNTDYNEARIPRNQVAPMSHLPPELLIENFHCVVMEPPELRSNQGEDTFTMVYGRHLTLASVCRKWRTTILGEQTLWADIRASYLSLTPTLIERSGAAPLSIKLEHLDENPKPFVDSMLERLSEQHALNIDFDWEMPLLYSMPNLRALCLTRRPGSEKPSNNQLSSLLRSMPKLRILALSRVLPTFTDSSHPIPTFSLPPLLTFFLLNDKTSRCISFLNHASFAEIPRSFKVFCSNFSQNLTREDFIAQTEPWVSHMLQPIRQPSPLVTYSLKVSVHRTGSDEGYIGVKVKYVNSTKFHLVWK